MTYHFARMGAKATLCGRVKTENKTFERRWTNNPSKMSSVDCMYCCVSLRDDLAEARCPEGLSIVGRGCFLRGFRAGWRGDPQECPYSMRGRSRVNRWCWNDGYVVGRKARRGS